MTGMDRRWRARDGGKPAAAVKTAAARGRREAVARRRQPVSGGRRPAAAAAAAEGQLPSSPSTTVPPPPHCAESMIALVQTLQGERSAPRRWPGRWLGRALGPEALARYCTDARLFKPWRPWWGRNGAHVLYIVRKYCTVHTAPWLIGTTLVISESWGTAHFVGDRGAPLETQSWGVGAECWESGKPGTTF